jgi:glyoxalase family protein
MKPLNGMHHVTAITSSAEKIYDFFTHVLGLRLVKKTVNQDDIQTYHLFFADDVGGPGTDMTFFDFPGAIKAVKGTNEIVKTSFRVPTDLALEYWMKRFDVFKVSHEGIQELFGIKMLPFVDFDEQEYVLISDQQDHGVKPGIPWQKGPIPLEFAIRGLGPVFFRVNRFDLMDRVLSEKLTFKKTHEEHPYYLYQTGLGGNGGSVIVHVTDNLLNARQGYGGVHHVAFSVDNETDIMSWISRLNEMGAGHSGYVDRFYFRSLYTRLYPGILFEFATDGPGFIDDEEPYETLGERLALPPRFRHQRAQIEKLVRHIDTKRSDKVYNKEYMDEVGDKHAT